MIQLDLLPTALASAGLTAKPDWELDGVDLLPYLNGIKTTPPHDMLFWRLGGQAAVRRGDWKLVRYDSTLDTPGARSVASKPALSPFRLYNLAEDIGETRDRSGDLPDKTKELLGAWEEWSQHLARPLWGPGSAAAEGSTKEAAR